MAGPGAGVFNFSPSSEMSLRLTRVQSGTRSPLVAGAGDVETWGNSMILREGFKRGGLVLIGSQLVFGGPR